MERICWTHWVAVSVTSACCVVASKHSSIMLLICSSSWEMIGLLRQEEQGLPDRTVDEFVTRGPVVAPADVAPEVTAPAVVGVEEEQLHALASELTDRRPLRAGWCWWWGYGLGPEGGMAPAPAPEPVSPPVEEEVVEEDEAAAAEAAAVAELPFRDRHMPPHWYRKPVMLCQRLPERLLLLPLL